jgi:hypothetical protein
MDQPWARTKVPTDIPAPLDDQTLAQQEDDQFAALIRDNLIPRTPDGQARQRWAELWELLSEEDDLAERTFDVLEEFLQSIDSAIGQGSLDEHQLKRAKKFRRLCEDGWHRLQREDDGPLGWAGKAGAGFNPAARKVIDELVTSIAEHRSVISGQERAEDRRLWAVLAKVGLDPDRVRRR